MRRWALVAIVVLVVLVVADRAAAAYAESEIDRAAGRQLYGIAGIDVQVRSFPFLGRLAVAGQVSRLDVRLHDVLGHGIDLQDIRFDASDVRLERADLLHGDVRVTDVGSVRITARIAEAEVQRVTHAQVHLLDGRATVTVRGATLAAAITVRDGRLRLAVGGIPALSVPLPDASLLPCRPQARVEEGALVASCTYGELPSFVAGAVVTVG